MGFDIQGFISKVEKFVNENKADRQGKTGDGQFDAYEKASLFNNKELLSELKNACEEDQSVQQQVQNDLGISLSSIKSRIEELTGTSGARRAPGAGGDDGGDDGDGGNGDGGITINITFNNNWYININVSSDTKDLIEALIKSFTESMQNISTEFFNKLVEYFNQKEDNFKEFLIGLFNKLYDNSGTSIELLQAILAQLESLGLNVSNMDQAIQDLLKVQINLLKTENFNLEKLVELVTENNQDTKEQNKILGLIYDALINMDNNQKNFFNKIMKMLENNEANYNQIVALLEAIKNENSENSEKLLKLVAENNEISKAILNALEQMNAKFEAYGDEFKALLKQIANKEILVQIEGADVNVNLDIDAIIAKLEAMMETLTSIDKNTGDTANYTKQILDAVNKLGVDVTSSLNAILEAIGSDSTKLDNLIELLNKMDKNNGERNKAVLDAIAALGVNIGELLEALKNLNIQVTVEGGGGSGGATDLSAVIDAININGGNITSMLGDIMLMLTTLNANVIEGNVTNQVLAQRIIDAIANIGTTTDGSGNTLNLDEIMDILRQILEAIKNHEVTITIDGDGNCHCNCGGGDGTNEGENQDWNNVLNAARRSSTSGIETVSTNPSGKQNSKKIVLNGQYGGLRGAHIIKDNGDGTVDVFNMGGQCVRHQVPKE